MRLIDADGLKNRFNNLRGRSIDEMKVIDEMPEHTGKWECVNSFFGTYKCSKCGQYITLELEAPFDKYCKYCGAHMS